MKRIWAYAFEIGIVMMGILLVINLLFPTFLSEGIYNADSVSGKRPATEAVQYQ